jgi:hypothetical protein
MQCQYIEHVVAHAHTVTTWLSKPKTIVNFFFIYVYLIHMVPVIKEHESSHHQNTIHTINSSFKSESYTNT